MRCLFAASLVVASLAGHVYGHRHAAPSPYDDGPVKRRKTLGFGPDHPHAVFHSSPYQIQSNGFTPPDPSMDPIEVARIFIQDVLLKENTNYKIREDSYHDKNTGVTHVYVRQLINGWQVVDGDMNINVKDGVVLSYGNSFYNGPPPLSLAWPDIPVVRDPRQEACDIVATMLKPQEFQGSGDQVVLGGGHVISEELSHIHNAHCGPEPFLVGPEDPKNFRPALLKFMATVTPDPKLAADIANDREKYYNEITDEVTNYFAPSASEAAADFVAYNVPGAISPVKGKAAYIQVPNAKGDATDLKLVWRFEVEMQDNWYETCISMSPPHNIISVVDWASDSPIPHPSPPPATYNVFAWGINDPERGERSINKENFDTLASPAGWHAMPVANDPSLRGTRSTSKGYWSNSTTTWGNNVFAQENWEGQNVFIDNYRPDGGKDKVFNFSYSPKITDKSDALAEAKKYINTTVAQLFYTTNLVHDLYYRYGFDEVSGNFQQYNFERGGKENDAVIANAQDGSGYNNANFMTPPDGQNGRMRMYLWNTAVPYRDGDLEAGIVIHELTHGLSTRLTGGPANSGCLGWGESGGMGEGWGDFLATTIRSNKNYSDYAMGAWAANRESGIRNYIYSLDESVNPSTYKTLDKPGYWGVHAIGEVWAEILWVVSQELIKKHGYSDDLFPPAPDTDGTVPVGNFYRAAEYGKPLVPKHGNSLMVQLVINAMKLQACRPTFFQARDAIIQADQVLTGGENFCDIWAGFAKRGLGPDAKVEGQTPWGGGIRTNGFVVPMACRDY